MTTVPYILWQHQRGLSKVLETAGEAGGVMLAVGQAVTPEQATVHLQALSILQMGSLF